MLNMVSSVLGQSRPGTLAYQNPAYSRDWWWQELARVSYVGGQEYLDPRMIAVDFQYPRAVTDGNDDTTVLGTQRFTVDKMQLRSLLHRHEREQIWEFENRRTRSLYINFYAPIINMLVDSVMRKPPTRTGDQTLETFWDAPDPKREQRMNTMMSHGLRWAQVYRIYYAIVDQDPKGDKKPYFYWVSPLDLLDWECDEKGDYVWVKQVILGNTERPTWNTEYKRVVRYRIWGRDTIETWQTDDKGLYPALIETRDNPLGVVPIVPLYANRNPDADHPDGVSQMADLPKIANGVYNLQSLILDMAYKQVFSLLIFPDKHIDLLQVGTSQVVGFDGLNATGKPEYISPDPEQPRVLMEMLGTLIEQARQAVGVGRGRSESSKQQQSADAMELENKATETIMVDIAGAAEDFERRLAKMVQRFKTNAASVAKDDTTTIDYPREFDVRSLQADVMEATSMRTLGMSPEIMQRLKQDIVRRKFAHLSSADLETLVETVKVEEPPVPPAPGEGGDSKPAAFGSKKPAGNPEDGNQDEPTGSVDPRKPAAGIKQAA